MRKRVLKALAPLDAAPVENSVQLGTPDVNITTGWVELKSLPDWPKRPTTAVRFPKFYEHQREWILKRSRKGGGVWVLVRVKRDWLLFDGQWAANNLGYATQATMRASALSVWDKRLNEEELLQCLSVS